MINDSVTRVSTGVAGLDKMLHGGFISQRAYLARGGPGSGKTTLGLHFLSSGAAPQQKALFISLIEPEEKIKYDVQTEEVEQEPLIKSMITKI